MLGPGMDPRKMQKMMKQMGIDSKEIAASRVIIETEKGSYVVENPEVVQITMQGKKSFQISGNVSFSEQASGDDLKLIIEQTGCSSETAEKALKENNGDLASAIMSIKENQ